MSTREIKQLLHESIENIDDGEFLLAVKQKEQIKNGKTISDRQADLLVEKWLSE
ncbi:MAG: hypothetical protein NT040_02485 [Bacteroidetes bacterium]|nr:hypothetical protein [Bacteroidota bacterium]